MRYPHEFERARKALLSYLEELYKEYKSFQKVADHIGVSKGTIYYVMRKDHIPTDPEICRALGLPEVQEIPVLICRNCGKQQLPNACKCKPKKSPSMEKKKPDKPKRIRVDIDPEMLSKKEVKAIRDLDKETRTKFLALLAGYDLHGEEDE